MPALFVDTGAFYAAADASDEHHQAAAAIFTARGRAGDLVTSDYVFVETWMLVRARLGRAAARMAPGGLGRSMGEGVAARAARRVLSMEMKVVDGGAEATMARPLSIIALPDGSGCTFYGSALAELLRVLTGFEGAMVHATCRGRGDPACLWRATAVGGYE